jgi:T4 RnlA family RNA ligase
MLNAKDLYQGLLDLCAPDDSPFYYVDHALDGMYYRVFTYRLGQYSDFCKAYGRECRGHMFQIRSDGSLIRIAALPPQKFFNYGENPFTMNIDFSQGADLVMDKVDGSLISSYMHRPAQIRLKSKTALESEQAVAAMKCLNANKPLADFVEMMTGNDYTVNMEYTSPHYRIVIPHQEDRLTVLNVRKHTGEYMPYASVLQLMKHKQCEQFLVRNLDVEDIKAFVESVPAMTASIEGFVIRIKNGETFKCKTDGYVALHRMKDSINSPKALYEVVVNEKHDDAKAAFKDDPFIVGQIEAMEKVVADIYTKIKVNAIGFHNANSGLDRKSYAIKGQAELERKYFGLAMSLYLDKEPDYKEFMLKNYKEFGIKESAPEDT